MSMPDQLSHRLSAVACCRKTTRKYRDAIGIVEIDWERVDESHENWIDHCGRAVDHGLGV